MFRNAPDVIWDHAPSWPRQNACAHHPVVPVNVRTGDPARIQFATLARFSSAWSNFSPNETQFAQGYPLKVSQCKWCPTNRKKSILGTVCNRDMCLFNSQCGHPRVEKQRFIISQTNRVSFFTGKIDSPGHVWFPCIFSRAKSIREAQMVLVQFFTSKIDSLCHKWSPCSFSRTK